MSKVILKSAEEIVKLRESALLVSRTLAHVQKHIKPGISTIELDRIAEQFIVENNAKPAFKNYKASMSDVAFPCTLCTSVNEHVVHGIPNDTILQEGDIISVDCGVELNGYFGDSAFTFEVGVVDDEKKKLLEVTKASLYKGIEQAVHGNRIGDIGFAVQNYVESFGYSVVRDLVGHGIGKNLHEPPEVPNFGARGRGLLLSEGLVIAIEPMINVGKKDIVVLKDRWTLAIKDKKPSAHFEHTVVVKKGEAEILTTFDFNRFN